MKAIIDYQFKNPSDGQNSSIEIAMRRNPILGQDCAGMGPETGTSTVAPS